MKITRRGASADHGLKSIEIKKPKFRWNPNTKTFDISSTSPVLDFSTSARHNYTIKIPLEELAKLINAAGQECKSIDSDEFVDSFAPVMPSLYRMMAVASEV